MIQHSNDAVSKIGYVNLQFHLIKGSGNFKEDNSSVFIPNLPRLIAKGILFMDM